jgi:hypothetical protein
MTVLLFGGLLWVIRICSSTVIKQHLASNLDNRACASVYPKDCSVMPFLRIFCPVEHKSFATSVETSIEHKASLPNMIKFSYCPYCYTLHGWTPDEAFFADPECEASNYEVANTPAPAGSNMMNVSRQLKEAPQQSVAISRTTRGRLRSTRV